MYEGKKMSCQHQEALNCQFEGGTSIGEPAATISFEADAKFDNFLRMPNLTRRAPPTVIVTDCKMAWAV
jgi:hypothetical protein